MIARHVETLFCDDIRHEINGKISYIGVYSSQLFVPSFPATLPKLCLSVKTVIPADEPLQEFKLVVFKDDDALQEIELDKEQLAEASDSIEEKTEEKAMVAQFMLVFSPIQFDDPCTLRVRVQTESGELRGVALKVDQATSSQPGAVPDKSQ